MIGGNVEVPVRSGSLCQRNACPCMSPALSWPIDNDSTRGVNVVSLQSNRLECRTHKLIETAVAHLDNIKIFAKGIRYHPNFFTVRILNDFTISHFIIFKLFVLFLKKIVSWA